MVKRLFSGWLTSSGSDMNLLRVPFDYQPEQEDECVVYCLWMILHYIKNKHPNDRVREETETLSPDEIMDDITIVEGGWRPDQDELTVLSKRTRTVSFNLNYWQGDPPQELCDFIEDNISKGLPVVPFINGLQLREGVRDDDGVHAVVAAGYNDEQIAIHDPWGYPEDLVDRAKLEDAWDPMFNQIITVTLSTRGEKMIGEEQ